MKQSQGAHPFGATESIELTDADSPAVVALCREALDLPEDAAEAADIVARLRETGPPEPAVPLPEPAAPPSGSAAPPSGSAAPPSRPAAPPGQVAGRQVTGFVAREGADLIGVALGSLSSVEPATGHLDLIAVRPDRRRRGIGRALLSRLEGELARLGAVEMVLAGNPPYYAWPGIDVRYTPAVCLAIALGYEHDQTAWNMTVDLSYDDSPALRSTAAAERRLAGHGVTVRRASAADTAVLAGFAQRHFGGSWPAEIAASLTRPDAGCHLAVRHGEIIGFASYGSSRPSWFGPMGTAPEAHGLGVGAVLLLRCLQDQRAAGHRQVQIGWVGPVPFYARSAGARIERVFFLYRKRLGSPAQ